MTRPGSRLVVGNFPQLLDADGVGLRILALGELEPVEELPAELAARALGEDRVAAGELHAELEASPSARRLADPHVSGRDAAHRAVVGVEDLGGRESREDLDSERLGLLGEPFHDIAEPDDIAAVVVEVARNQEIRNAPRSRRRQDQDVVSDHGLVERRAALLPVRE